MLKINKISEVQIKGLKTVRYYSSDKIYNLWLSSFLTKRFNIHLGIFGVFDTFNVKWTYYVYFTRKQFYYY